MALLILPLQAGAALATEETDAQLAILKTGTLLQKMAFFSSIPVCGPLPRGYEATIKATALDEKQRDAVRILAGVALCNVPSAYASILPLLAQGSSNPQIATSKRSAALTVIQHIAAKAIEANETDLLPQLEGVKEQVLASKAAGAVEGTEADASVEKIEEAIRYLQKASEAKFWNLALKFADEHARAVALGGAYLLVLIALLSLSIVSPQRVVAIDETLQKLSVKLPDWAGGSSISTRYLLMTNLLVRSERVLDQWIASKLPAARSCFERGPFSQAPEAAQMSLKVDGTTADAALPSIRGLLNSGNGRIMILGTSGLRSGLLAQISKWSLAGELLPKAAFPLWLDHHLLASCKDGANLFEKSRNLFKLSIESDIGEDFFSLLISRRRVVLIVPDLSKADARAMADLMTATFPSRACIFLGTDEAPKALLISFARIELAAVLAEAKTSGLSEPAQTYPQNG